jgi:8-oxo-dGTP diphosphatase
MEQKMTFGEKMDGIPYRIRQGVYAVIINNADETVAVVKTSTGYFLPGGGIEANETHHECLKREVLEELGCEIHIGKFIGRAEKYFYSTTLREYMNSDGYFYAAEIVRKLQVPTEDDHELVWMKLVDAPNLLFHEHQVWAVNKAINL